MPDQDLLMRNLLAVRKKAQRKYCRSSLADDKYALKKASWKLSPYCRRLRRAHQSLLCKAVNNHTSFFRVGRVVQTLINTCNYKEPFRCLSLTLGRTAKETAVLFADIFVSTNRGTSTTAKALSVPYLEAKSGRPCNCFTRSQLNATMYNKRWKCASGPDDLFTQALQSPPESSKRLLLDRLNLISITSSMPEPW